MEIDEKISEKLVKKSVKKRRKKSGSNVMPWSEYRQNIANMEISCVSKKKRRCSWVVFLDLLDNKDKDLEENANSDSDESGVPRVFTRQQILNSFTLSKIS